MSLHRLLLIIGASTVFTGALVALVVWMLGHGEDAATKASKQFAGALVTADPSLAPKGAADHLDGLRSHFGEITDARVLQARNHRVGSGGDGRTYFVADLHLQTARGPAVVELEFDSPSLTDSSTVTDVRELEPSQIKGLDDAELTAVAKASLARGGEPATGFNVHATIAERPRTTDAPPRKVQAERPRTSSAQRKALRRLRCVQDAEGDVEQMARCAL